MKKKFVIPVIIVGVILVGYFVVKGNKGADNTDILVNAESGTFTVEIETTGELEAKNSVKILGPSKLREFRIHSVAIESIVEEGKVVRKGERIATLDRSELQNKIQDAQLEVDKEQSRYIQTQLDTTLIMRQARDELINLEYAVEEKQIVLEQSQFEPPATIKQAEINVDKAERAYEQAKSNYDIREQQNRAKMNEVAVELAKERRELAVMMGIMDQFTILAPEDGMLIYKKNRDGTPMKEGSTISSWDPVVAELPDLTTMISKTYVNEVDIRKIQRGQQVAIGLDAFPDKKLTGTVIKVANVGEQRPNSDAKVFRVDVQVHGQDDLLRPAMTTSNKIMASVVEDATFVPLECLHTQFDSITYVIKRVGLNAVKQEVQVGETNANEAIILAGIDAGQRLYLSLPASIADDLAILIPEMDGKRNEPEAEPEVIQFERPSFTPGQRPQSQRGEGGQRPQRPSGTK